MAGAALIAWMLVFMRPTAAVLLPPAVRTPLVVSLTGAALGIGVATLVPFWLMLLMPGSPVFPVTLAVTGIAGVAGVSWTRWRRAAHRAAPPGDEATVAHRHPWLERLLAAMVGAVAAGILFNAAFWPFDNGDALALYAPFGRHILETRTLPQGEGVYEAYPMLVPTGFAFTGWAAGGANEYVARLFAAVLGVLSLAGAGALGAAVGGARCGWIAAGLVAATPVFGRWASTGYTDVPASLFAVLAALFAWEWARLRSLCLLVLAGVMVGLAAWTKNSALALVPSLAAVVLCTTWERRQSVAGWLADSVRPLAVALGAAAGIAAPWYVRSLVLFGFAVPPTAYTDRARHDLSALLLILRPDQHFGIAGWIFAAGLVGALGAAIRQRARRTVLIAVLAWVLPFVLAWWWLASYETRFLMVVVPLLAVLGAVALDAAGRVVVRTLQDRRRAPNVRRVAHAATTAMLTLGVAFAGLVSLRKAVEHKAALMATPWPSDAERHRIRLGDLWDLVVFLREQPPGSRLAGVPPVLRYHMGTAARPVVSWGPLASPDGADLHAADLFVVAMAGMPAPAGSVMPVARIGTSFIVFRAVGAEPRQGMRP